MKMIIMILILMAFLSDLAAPPHKTVAILVPEVVNPYEPIVKAVTFIESSNGKVLLNEKEMAVGWFGIRPVRLKDYNDRTGKSITLDQCYDYETGKMIFLYYASQFDPGDIKGICVSWNGRSIHDHYYSKIIKQLNTNQL